MIRLQYYVLIFFIGVCLNSCNEKSEYITGKWINLNAIELNDNYLFEFDGEELYSSSIEDVFKHQIEYKHEDQLLIRRGNKYFNYKIILNTDDEIVLKSDVETVRLVPVSIFTKSQFEKDFLLKHLWAFELENNEDYNNSYLTNEFEFTGRDGVLHSFLSTDSIFSFNVMKYELFNIDSVSILRLDKPIKQTIFIKEFSSESISGLRAVNGNELQHVVFKATQTDNRHYKRIFGLLDGYWVNSGGVGNINSVWIDDQLDMIIIDSDKFRYLEERTFDLSKNFRFILLDNLVNGNDDIIELLNVESNKISIKYNSDDVTTLSRNINASKPID